MALLVVIMDSYLSYHVFSIHNFYVITACLRIECMIIMDSYLSYHDVHVFFYSQFYVITTCLRIEYAKCPGGSLNSCTRIYEIHW